MAEEVKKHLYQLLSRVQDLYCIIITDRDGVPVFKVTTDKAPEMAMRPGFLSTFALAVDQGGKLGIGKTQTLVSIYSQYQIVQMNKLPLVVSFIASESSNTGHILSLEKHLDPILNELKVAVGEQ